jgi:hypothetical protein
LNLVAPFWIPAILLYRYLRAFLSSDSNIGKMYDFTIYAASSGVIWSREVTGGKA